MTLQNKCHWFHFCGGLWGSAYATDHLRPKVWYENDRKNMETLIVYKCKKKLIFDQRILEIAIANFMPHHDGNGSTNRTV